MVEDNLSLPAAGAVINGTVNTMAPYGEKFTALCTSGNFLEAAQNDQLRDQVNGCLTALKALAEKTGKDSPAVLRKEEVMTALKSAGYDEEYLPALAQ